MEDYIKHIEKKIEELKKYAKESQELIDKYLKLVGKSRKDLNILTGSTFVNLIDEAVDLLNKGDYETAIRRLHSVANSHYIDDFIIPIRKEIGEDDEKRKKYMDYNVKLGETLRKILQLCIEIENIATTHNISLNEIRTLEELKKSAIFNKIKGDLNRVIKKSKKLNLNNISNLLKELDKKLENLDEDLSKIDKKIECLEKIIDYIKFPCKGSLYINLCIISLRDLKERGYARLSPTSEIVELYIFSKEEREKIAKDIDKVIEELEKRRKEIEKKEEKKYSKPENREIEFQGEELEKEIEKAEQTVSVTKSEEPVDLRKLWAMHESDLKCPIHNIPLEWDPRKKKYWCRKCLRHYTLDEIKKLKENLEEKKRAEEQESSEKFWGREPRTGREVAEQYFPNWEEEKKAERVYRKTEYPSDSDKEARRIIEEVNKWKEEYKPLPRWKRFVAKFAGPADRLGGFLWETKGRSGKREGRAAIGIVGILISIIIYFATASLFLFLPLLAVSIYLIVSAGKDTIRLIEDHPILIASLILSTLAFMYLSWWGLLAGPAFLALSKTIPKEKVRSSIGKFALYIMLVISFIVFLPHILAYTAIEINWIWVVAAGLVNGFILGITWTAMETSSKEELERKLLIEQLKKLKMEEEELKERTKLEKMEERGDEG